MSADTIATIANAAYAETLTQVSPADLRSDDLRKEAERGCRCNCGECEECEPRSCYRSTKAVGADAVEVVFYPEVTRAAVAPGSDAEWTDASSAADALRRYLNDDMSL